MQHVKKSTALQPIETYVQRICFHLAVPIHLRCLYQCVTPARQDNLRLNLSLPETLSAIYTYVLFDPKSLSIGGNRQVAPIHIYIYVLYYTYIYSDIAHMNSIDATT